MMAYRRQSDFGAFEKDQRFSEMDRAHLRKHGKGTEGYQIGQGQVCSDSEASTQGQRAKGPKVRELGKAESLAPLQLRLLSIALALKPYNPRLHNSNIVAFC
jgi:hypothetical protein